MHLTGHGYFLVLIVMLRSFIKYTNEKCVCMAILKMISFTRDKNNCKIWHVRRTHNFRQIVQMLCVLSDQSVKHWVTTHLETTTALLCPTMNIKFVGMYFIVSD